MQNTYGEFDAIPQKIANCPAGKDFLKAGFSRISMSTRSRCSDSSDGPDVDLPATGFIPVVLGILHYSHVNRCDVNRTSLLVVDSKLTEAGRDHIKGYLSAIRFQPDWRRTNHDVAQPGKIRYMCLIEFSQFIVRTFRNPAVAHPNQFDVPIVSAHILWRAAAELFRSVKLTTVASDSNSVPLIEESNSNARILSNNAVTRPDSAVHF